MEHCEVDRNGELWRFIIVARAAVRANTTDHGRRFVEWKSWNDQIQITAKKNAPGAAPGGKKGKKQIQKKSLGEFLGVQKGTSWASDDEEEFMNAPATTETGARDASDWRAGPSKGDGMSLLGFGFPGW